MTERHTGHRFRALRARVTTAYAAGRALGRGGQGYGTVPRGTTPSRLLSGDVRDEVVVTVVMQQRDTSPVLALANLVAALPGQAAARTTPAGVLRTE